MRDGDATRQKILDAARALFADLGPDAASTREITRRAGVGIDRINAHYGSKEALFVELVELATQELAAACADPDSAVAWFTAATEHEQAAKVLAWDGMHGDTDVLVRLAGEREDRQHKIAHALLWVVFPGLRDLPDYQRALSDLDEA